MNKFLRLFSASAASLYRAPIPSKHLTNPSFRPLKKLSTLSLSWPSLPFSKVSKPIAESAGQEAKSHSTKRIVGYWYLYTGTLVFGIVTLGGVTRLTESGLSITVGYHALTGTGMECHYWNETTFKSTRME